jgi:23S rRNA pseudouridine2457 synthase
MPVWNLNAMRCPSYLCQDHMMPSKHRYFVLNKPFNMVSQFVSVEDVRLLCDLDFDFPAGTHVIGRLDSLSEGLLLLTTNKKVMKLLFQGKTPHKRTYLVRVTNVISSEKVQQLREGVTIRVRGQGDYMTAPCEIHLLDTPPDVLPHQLEQNPYISNSWLQVSLYEGKFHQIRNMMSAVKHQCRRLIRISIEDMVLGDLAPGCVREIVEEDFFKLLKIGDWDK